VGLTAVAIKAAKGRAKPYKLTDSDGLHLLVLPSGGRDWRINNRYLGKDTMLDVWPETVLADARAKRDGARLIRRSSLQSMPTSLPVTGSKALILSPSSRASR
jgi:Arm DNA-binding domain